ncbi:MAG: nucleotidyltransferase family protein [Bacteroidales bacterium]|nr:nucleotidyltransferase family protein [Bacteroidales bacterium]MBN2698694.1 nucleotidyltransferase family protein [Bacteroidales bacterium]
MPHPSAEQLIVFSLLKGEPVHSLEGVNGPKLVDLIRRHKLFPIAEGLLKMMKEPERGELKKGIQVQSIKSQHLSSVLTEIFSEFKNSGIEALALKGPVLARALYGDVIKRSFNDLDILVKQDALWDTIEVLKTFGFKLLYPRENLTGKQWEYYFRYQKEVGLVHVRQKSYIELHTGIYIHELLRKSEEFILLEEPVEELIYESSVGTLNRENTFLYLVYHGAYHLYNRLFWLRDVAQAQKTWKLDHQSVLDKASQLGIDRLLGVSLLLSESYAGIPIPETYAGYLKRNRHILRRLAGMCHRRICGKEHETVFGKLRRNIYFSLLKPGLHYRLTVFKSLFHRWYIRHFLGGH